MIGARMSLVAVAQQVGITPAARVLPQHPELIQELLWQPRRILDPGFQRRTDPLGRARGFQMGNRTQTEARRRGPCPGRDGQASEQGDLSALTLLPGSEMATKRSRSFGRAWKWSVRSAFLCTGVLIRHVRGNAPMMGDDGTSQSRDARSVSQSRAETAPNPLTSHERWARWQEKGVRHDARVARNMRVIAATTLTIGVIWASVSLR